MLQARSVQKTLKMKPVVIFLFVVCAAILKPSAGAGMTMEQLKNAAKMFRNSCAPKTGVSKDVLAKMSAGVLVEDDKKLRCYMKCVQGMMQANKKGRYSPETALAQITKTTMLSPELKTKLKAGIEACKDAGKDEADACDLAYEIVKCGIAHDPENFFFP